MADQVHPDIETAVQGGRPILDYQPPKPRDEVSAKRVVFATLCGLVAVPVTSIAALLAITGPLEVARGNGWESLALAVPFGIAAYFLWKPTGMRLLPRPWNGRRL